MAARLPALEPWCGSWVVVSRATDEAVLETFSPVVAGAVNLSRYEVLTTYQWLCRFNALVRASGGVQPDPVALLEAVR